MIAGVGRWFDSRLHLAKGVRRALNHVFPDHWSFMLGEIAVYSFVLLIITGAFLAMFFNASSTEVVYHGSYKALDGIPVSAAYNSVLHLSFDVPAGLLIRQMHHWAALVFVAAIVLHLGRIFFTAAYRRPREINWLIGLTLLLLAMGNGFLGYSVGGDLLSGTGLRIAYSILLSIPVIGPRLTFIFFGGTVPTNVAIPRMYSLHIFIIPAMLAALLALHLAIIWRQKHTNYPGPGRTDRSIVGSRLWPSYAAKSLGLCFLVFGFIAALGAFVQINPVWIYGPDNTAAVLPSAQPDWYLGWMEGALRLFPGVHLRLGTWLIPEIFFPGILFPVLIFVLLYAYPFLERLFSGDDEAHNVLRLPYQQPFNTAFGCAAFIFLLVLFFAGSDDVIAVASDNSVVAIRTILRIMVFVAPAVTAVLAYAACLIVRRRHSASHSD
ncbi:MAG: cytochrome bc1 complex cytochrome b subunit [Candidatus Acidiferrales bacterium]